MQIQIIELNASMVEIKWAGITSKVHFQSYVIVTDFFFLDLKNYKP